MADPFQPKFVDLVRNYSTTTGTDNFTLGPAVNGYTGFTAACQVGDRFYYSAIGVDKPAEREVGRGTLLAGGVISREPVNGPKTNFTSGNKSIALIAAAEWFSTIQAAGGGSSSVGAPTRSALAGSTQRQQPMLLTEAGREGLFTWDASDLSAKVAADTAQGIYVPPAASTGLATNGSQGAWVRKFDGALNINWFGAAADDNGTSGTDNLAAINGALALAKAFAVSSTAGPTIYFPAGRYYVSAGFNLKIAVRLLGDATGMLGTYPATWLRFPSGSYGIAINGSNTVGYGAPGAVTTSGEGAIIEGLGLLGGATDQMGGGAAYDEAAQADGILMRARATIRNCEVRGFQRNGIAIYAGSDANPLLGNANHWLIEGNNTVVLNGMHGIHVTGTDANAGRQLGQLNAIFNRRWGVLSQAAIGNTWDVVQGVNSGIGNGTTDIDAVCCLAPGGQRYVVKFGQEAGASTNAPPNATYWLAVPGMTGGRVWSSGMTFRSGGPMALRDNSNCLRPYKEDGDNPYQHASGTLHISTGPNTHTVGGAYLGTNLDSIMTQRGFTITPRSWETGYGMDLRLGGEFAEGDCFYFQPNAGKAALRLFRENSSNDFLWDFGYSQFNILRFTGQDTTLSFGRSAQQSYKLCTNDLFLGFNNNARWVSTASEAPTSGSHAAGEIVFNIAPSAGGKVGWVCVTPGSPGTWKPFGVIDP